ncbi:MAG TPA: hypothetical protein VLB12_09845 [Gemmatimonadales bacterium]|nr:hypothetical protein [Gemmatimonadales bacterium]
MNLPIKSGRSTPALAGDPAGAIRAYQHYLALRPDAEPEVKPEVERVSVELAKLMRQRGT